GIDSTGFVRGQGSYQRMTGTVSNSGAFLSVPSMSAQIQVNCLGGPLPSFEWVFLNFTVSSIAGPTRAGWLQQGTTGAISIVQIPSGFGMQGSHPPILDGVPEHWTLTVSDVNGGSATIDVWTMRTGTTCQYAVQVLS